jgi:CubicO group peptidase (beta-lactamase class C family)
MRAARTGIAAACAALGIAGILGGGVDARESGRGVQAATLDSANVARLADSLVPRAMREEQIPGAVVAVVSGGRVLFARGYGVADLETRRPVSPESTIFRIGSISKVFTATAVTRLADRGQLDLRADVNRYLNRVKVPETQAEPVTAWHLLTHSAALDEIRPGTRADRESELQPLDRFLRGRLVRIAPPGVVTSYSTYGITVAGALIEDVSGEPFEAYLRRHLWMPLDMDHTSITLPASDKRLVATPYDVEDGKIVPAPWEWYHTTPASSINATALDMARFMATMLNGGMLPPSFGHGAGRRVLSERMTREMLSQQLTMHPRVPGFGLGWQLSDANGERIAEHGGDVAGAASLVTLLPDRGVGLFVASHREGSGLRYALRQALLDRFYPRPAPPPVVALHHDPERAKRYTGHYRASSVCHTCTSPMRVYETDVTANPDGTLTFSDRQWVEVADGFFRSTDGIRRVGFHADRSGAITHYSAGSFQVMERVR